MLESKWMCECDQTSDCTETGNMVDVWMNIASWMGFCLNIQFCNCFFFHILPEALGRLWVEQGGSIIHVSAKLVSERQN